MFAMGQNHPSYIPSSILAKKIQNYYAAAKSLLPFLEANCSTHQISSETDFNQTFKALYSTVDPVIVHIRSAGHGAADATCEAINTALVRDEGFFTLNVKELLGQERDRRTTLGNRILHSETTGKKFGLDIYIQLLKPIIFSGDACRTKFVLNGFPETTEQVEAFEQHCSTINAIILATDKGNHVEFKGETLGLFNIDSMFQKQFRLKTMEEWSTRAFEAHLGNQTQWGFVTGRQGSGKSVITREVAKLTNSHVIDMNVITEECKKKMAEAAGEEEAPEEVPIGVVEQAIVAVVKGHQDAGKNVGYIFDGYSHKSGAEFMAFACGNFGAPGYWLPVDCSHEAIGERWKKKNEADEIAEDQMDEFKTDKEKASKE